MKPEELRIGNFINFNWWFNSYAKVDSIDSVSGYVTMCSHGDEFPMDQVSPIPLTPEWIEKLGFINNRISINSLDHLCYCQYGNSWSIRYQTKGSGFTRDYGIAYIHQLQNLYYALTGGKELEAISEYNT